MHLVFLDFENNMASRVKVKVNMKTLDCGGDDLAFSHNMMVREMPFSVTCCECCAAVFYDCVSVTISDAFHLSRTR